LLADYKIADNNKVYFTEAPSMGEDPYYVSGRVVKKYKKESNGRINCYAVPLSELEPFMIETPCEHDYK
jgi:hypothetical protein